MRFVIVLIALLSVVSLNQSCSQERIIDNTQPTPPAPPPLPPIPPPVTPLPGLVTFEAFESEMLTDATGLPSVQQENARFITICDQYNSKYLNLPAMRRAVEKAVNQLSLESDVEAGQWIGAFDCTLRVDQRDYGWDDVITYRGRKMTKWQVIEATDPLRFESFTDRGVLLKALTDTARPWVHGANFIENAMNNETYYAIMEVPNELNTFLDQYLGCNLQRDFDDFNEDLFLAGVRRSLIALQKNRGILFTQCQEGAMSGTYDVILEGQTSPERSLSINPFPIEARTGRTFGHDASEYIFTLPNQMLGYALFNAAGNRENFAPTNIVTDNIRANIDPTIRNARSCSSCHTGGFIEVSDFITDHVRGNPNFEADDIQKAQAYFGRNQGMRAAIRQANLKYQAAVQILQIDINSPDPINELTDQIRKEMDARQIAAILFLSEQDFIARLRASPGGSLAVGQLISGGTVSFQDFILAAPILVSDLNLFQEDLGQ